MSHVGTLLSLFLCKDRLLSDTCQVKKDAM
jgi:hypothetical protein